MMQDSEWYKTQVKIQKIQMRAHCMRARSPPKSLFKATSRENIKDEVEMMAGARSPTKLADQLIKQGILDDEHYNQMRQTLRSSGNTLRHTGSLSLSPTKSSRSGFSMNSSGFGSSGKVSRGESGSFGNNSSQINYEQTLSSPKPSSSQHSSSQQPATEEDYSTHPMVRELTSRTLTTAAGKRKLQATVKREVETMLKETAKNNDLDLKNVSIF